MGERKLNIVAVDPSHASVRSMMRELDAELARQNGGRGLRHTDPGRFVREGGYFVVARRGRTLLGCGGYRPLDCDCAEVKRIFVRPTARGRGVGRRILRHLEEEIRRCGFLTVVLDLGGRREGLLQKFEAEGYTPIPPFLNHVGNPLSRCLAKRIVAPTVPSRRN